VSLDETQMKYTNTTETWYRVWCPYCDEDNWYCNGNEKDLSQDDVEAIMCRNCNKTFGLGIQDDLLEELRGDEPLNTETGVKLIERGSERCEQ
jgi:hypothetical protein